MIKVLVAVTSISHFRVPLYQELVSNKRIDYKIMASENSKEQSLKVASREDFVGDSELLRKWIVNDYILLPFGLVWHRGLVREVAKGGYDVIIMSGDSKHLAVWVAMLVQRVLGRKSMLWTHGLKKLDLGIKRRVRATFYSLADGLLLFGNRGKELVSELGVRKPIIRIVNNSLNYPVQKKLFDSISSDEIGLAREKLGVSEGAKVVVTTGRMSSRKRIDLLISALAELESSIKMHLVVVGDGPQLDALKDLSRSLGVVDKVSFVGPCYKEEELAYYMRAADLYVLPGDAGLSVIHGLTYGLPVITHDDLNTQGPEVEAIREGVTGSLYRAYDLSDLKKKIEHWLVMIEKEGFEVAGRCQAMVEENYTPSIQAGLIGNAVFEMVGSN